MALEQEMKTYAARLPEFKEKVGKFVLIHKDEVCGFFDTYTDALRDGYEKFGQDPFLVKRIQIEEQALYFTRALASCR